MTDIIDLPLPPLSSRKDSSALKNPLVSISHIDGSRSEGTLQNFNVDDGDITITPAEDGAKNITISMYDINYMNLPAPLVWVQDENILKNECNEFEVSHEAQDFSIVFKDNTTLTGKTYGSRVDRNGLHLFKMHGDNESLCEYTHFFIPKTSIKNNSIGDYIGEILSKDTGISTEVIERVAKEQEVSRLKPLGEFLVEKNIVDPEQLINALKRQEEMPNLKLGEILLGEALISEVELGDALKHQKRDRQKPLGEILVSKGLISRDKIQKALVKKLGIPFVNLRDFSIEPNIIKLVSAEVAFTNKIVPLSSNNNSLIIAIENPMDWAALDALRFHISQHIEPVMASAEAIDWALQFYYTVDDVFHNVDNINEALEKEKHKFGNSISFNESDAVTENIVVKIINKIIMDGYKQGASDIHIEPNPGQEKIIVRFRKDGTLYVYHEFPNQYSRELISRIKVMAQLDISEKRKPQDGKITFKKFGPADIELRVATLPTTDGLEDVVMRILSSGKNIPINALGLSLNNRDKVMKAIDKPYGLFLVCGPTGSGKTTTLHSVLGHLNHTKNKILTAEDPIEISQPGLRQLQINKKIGLDFSTAMRAFLRADPDIIMIGEMRDSETAGIVIEASLTGHLVFSTLHTNSAAESVIRLLDMGMDSFNFADALIGILAQRLAKTLCSDCKESYHADVDEILQLAHEYLIDILPDTMSEATQKTHIDELINDWQQRFSNPKGQFTLYKPNGCDNCNNTGYRGRIGIHELLIASDKIKHMILTKTPALDIHREALNAGMCTLKQDGIEKILQGYLDLSNVRAVCIK